MSNLILDEGKKGLIWALPMKNPSQGYTKAVIAQDATVALTYQARR